MKHQVEVSLAHVRTFIRIVDRGSISAAAADLGTTQPTVSRQLRGLERAYGMPLLVRTTRSLTLTEGGRLLYEQGRRMIEADDAVRERQQGESRELSGRLRITAPSGFGAFFVAPACARFVNRHTHIALDLLLSDRKIDLVHEGIDVAVRIGRLENSSMFSKHVATLEEVIVVHPSLLTAPISHPDQLGALPWIARSGPAENQVVRIERRGHRHVIRMRPRLTIDQVTGYREALLAGAGAGLIHRYAVEADVRAGRLAQVLPGWRLPKWPVHLLYPLRSQTGRLRRWSEEIVADMAHLPGLSCRSQP